MAQELKIKKAYKDLVPHLSNEDYANLRNSIESHGYWSHMKILANPQGEILDGHHRYEVCQSLGIEPDWTEINLPNPKVNEPLFIIKNTLARRQLNNFQRSELALKFEEHFSEQARERKRQGGKEKKPQDEKTKGTTREKVAEIAKVSHNTIDKAKVILEKGTEEQINKARAGKSINNIYAAITNSDKHKAPPPMPEGQWDIIYADPPWHYDNAGVQGAAENHYLTMDIDEIKSMNVPAAKSALLFMWTTAPQVPTALEVMDAWGFGYRTSMVWVKPNEGVGFYVRSKFELLFIGKRGNIPVPEEKNRPAAAWNLMGGKHSEKPEKFYELIEQMYPGHKYLELFARDKPKDKQRKNWTYWGNET